MLQCNFRECADLLETIGVRYISPSEVQLSPLGVHFKTIARGGFASQLQAETSVQECKAFVSQISDHSSNARTLLFSWEGFLGTCALDVSRRLYPHAHDVADSLQRIFGDNAAILLIVRRQDRFIESSWRQQLKEGRLLSFDSYCEAIHLDSLSWLDLAEAVDAFFPSTFSVVPLETLSAVSPSLFVSICLHSLGINLPNGDALRLIEHANKSISDDGAEALLAVAALLTDSNQRRATFKFFRALFPSDQEHTRFVLSGAQRKQLVSHYAASNERLLGTFFRDCPHLDVPTRQALLEIWRNNS
jgi:hypothetical protein